MLLEQFQNEVAEVVNQSRDSVVTVKNIGETGYFGGSENEQGAGSGMIVSSSGYIVTNSHVVRNAAEITVTVPNQGETDARIIGVDPLTDVAILKIKANQLPSLEFQSTESLRAGQFVLAIGNALGLPGDPTVSMGIISALGRPLPWADFIFEGLIQTDAAINPGNSGGPLLTLSGKVAGMNTAMVPFAQGIGFAIPSDTITRVMEQILENGKVVRPWIGISGASMLPGFQASNRPNGVVVVRVTIHGPAYEAGIRPGDIITGADGKQITGMRELITQISSKRVGDTLEIDVLRDYRRFKAEIHLTEMPNPKLKVR
ncbi:trypsin-like peptidase domain-containing protein [Thermoplasmatales archaeon AK]|nr:trypsin-like peptidase domain-containing protein [Thermoplasmatales archaeon AK]